MGLGWRVGSNSLLNRKEDCGPKELPILFTQREGLVWGEKVIRIASLFSVRLLTLTKIWCMCVGGWAQGLTM